MVSLMKHLRIPPTSPTSTPGGLYMWFRIFQSRAILYKCRELLLFEGDTPNVYHPDVIALDDERNPIEGDAYCQRRLSVLLWAWTDKDDV